MKGTHLVTNLLDNQIALTLIKSGVERGLTPFVFGLDGEHEALLHSNPDNLGQEMFLKHRSGDKRLRYVNDIHLLDSNITLNFIAAYEELSSYKQWAEQKFTNSLRIQFMEDTYLPGYHTLEFYHPQADKGRMLNKAVYITLDSY